MKKTKKGKLFQYIALPKFNLTMRLTILLLIVSLFKTEASTYSQNTRVSLALENVTVAEVFKEIEAQTEFKFLFNHAKINADRKLSIHVDKELITTVLKEMFFETTIYFKVRKKQIILKKNNKKSTPVKGEKSDSEQQRTIKGTVFDENDTPLPGASIVVEGTTIGTISDFDGLYSIDIPDTATTLVVSYVGFLTKKIAITAADTINIKMKIDAAELSEVIVTGYTSERKSDLTGAVAIVEMDEVVGQPVASVDNMLQGKVSGVNVVSSGSPGGASTLRIRGYSTIRNNDPLYVIDGVPTTEGINLINPNDIASLQVLKDASSSSIYGSRAANGVVIITTKKGKSEKIKIAFNMYTGIQNARNLPKNLNAKEYGDVYWQAFANDGIAPNHDVYGNGTSPVIPEFLDAEKTIRSSDTNWIEELFNPAIVQSYNLTVSKGGEKSHSLFSLGYFDQEGVLEHTNFNRITARLNSDYKLFNNVTIGENLTVAYSKSVNTETNSLLGNVVYNAFRIPSIAPVYNINGEYSGYPLSDIENPLGKLERSKDNKLKKVRIFGNVFAEIELINSLKFKTNFGINYTTSKSNIFNPTFQEPNVSRDINDLTVNDQVKFDWVWSNTLNYAKTFKEKHNVNVLVGIESIENLYEWTRTSIQNLPANSANVRVLKAGDLNTQLAYGDKIEYSLFSYFAKINYNFDSKYLFSATLRRDGTSKLLNNRWGTFPALSAGWKISEEDFFNKEGLVSTLKLRTGWGITGNQDIPAYQTISGFNSNPYYSNYALDGSQNNTQRGFTLSRVANPDLKWETTTQFNVGLDVGLLENALNLSVDYFSKKTEDLLLLKTLPQDIAGITNRGQWSNVGEMENKGFELSADYQSDRSKDFNFNVGVNLSVIRNKLVELEDGLDFIETDPSVLHETNFDQATSRTAVGQPIASFYGHVVSGIFQSDAAATANTSQPDAVAGDFIFEDINGDGAINDDDRTFIGSPHADFTYGINFSGNYKAFDFTLFFQGSQGNDIYDLSRYYSDFFDLANYNKSERILDAWSPQNTGSGLARVSLNDPNNNIRPSSYYVQDGSYLRLKTLQVGYSFSTRIAEKIKASKIRIYLETYNLFTITGYKGLDPEIGLQNYDSDDRNLDIGVDRGIYPSSQTFTLGLNLNF